MQEWTGLAEPLRKVSLHQLPHPLDVFARRADVADGETQAELAVEDGVGEEHFARSVDPFDERLVFLITALLPEAYEREWSGRHTLEAAVGIHLARQFLGPRDLVADDLDDAFAAVVAEHEPELQRAKAPAQGYPIIHKVDRARVLGGPEVFRHQRKGAPQDFRTPRIQHADVNGREQPFVRIGDQRIGALAAIENMLEFRRDGGGARVGGVDVQPELVTRGDIGHGLHWIDAGGRRSANRRHYAERA